MTRISLVFLKKIYFILLIAIVAFSLAMCKSNNIISAEHTSELLNPYKFNSQIESRMYRDSLNPEFEYASTLYSLKSDYRKALSLWDSILRNQERSQAIDTCFIKDGYQKLPADEYIIKQSQNFDVVVLNEAHHNNSHRVFAESLLEGLYESGYRLLFLEALYNDDKDTLLNQREYPIDKSGFYSKNPQYGNFIRKALKLGFRVFPYETTGTPDNTDGIQREVDQANNVVSILKKHPSQKALIFVGYGHNREGKVAYWEKSMTERVKDLTGIDPLTISQDKFSEKSSKALSIPLLVDLNLKQPSVLLNKKNEPYKTKTDSSWTDITVFHPFTEYKNGRANWLFYEGKESVNINLDKVTINYPILVMAYNNEEELLDNAVPLDVVEIKNKDEQAILVLNNGNYVVKIVNESNIAQTLRINVN